MTALPARSLLPAHDPSAGPDDKRPFHAERRLARLATDAAEAGLFLVHDGAADAGDPGRVVCEGLGRGSDSRAAQLARRVLMAGEVVAISPADAGSAGDDAERIGAFLGVPIGSEGTPYRGCLCVMDPRAREWSATEVAALRDLASMIERDLGRRPVAETRHPLEAVVRMLATAVENMQLGVTITDLSGRIVYTNPAEARMHGYRVDELIGRNARIFGPPEHFRSLDMRDRNAAVSWTRETVNVRKDGSRFEVLLWSDVVSDAAGNPIGLVTCCEDITDRKCAERTLRDVALRDPLTGLPNRSCFHERLARAAERRRQQPRYNFAVLFLDLDRFKTVNDSLGHHVGDEMLRVVATRLLHCVRPDDTVARFGGDEFAVLLEEIGPEDAAEQIAGRILRTIAEPIRLSDYELVTSASIGVVRSSLQMSEPEVIWQAADMAMYRAKASGTGRYEVFDCEMHLQAKSRLRVETDLRGAVERGEFRLEYQPVLELATGRTVGFEALLRWDHPERGEMQPADFLAVAEETGLILRLGEWVLRTACLEAKRWQEATGGATLWVAVNLSGKQLGQPQLPELVREALTAAGVAPDLLRLEITEASVMDGGGTAAETLRELSELGVPLLLDDFGTGYSSLSYLHRLPLDAVKIDRSFVDGLRPGNRQSKLLGGVVRLARDAGLRVIAEGVAEPQQLALLTSLGCDLAQGYLFAPAMSPKMIPAHLARAWRSAEA